LYLFEKQLEKEKRKKKCAATNALDKEEDG
jgi:hypothetical protein